MKTTIILLASLAAAASADAQVNATWVGTTGSPASNWSLATNWSTNPQVPNSAMDSATMTNAQTVLNLGVVLKDLTMSGTTSLSIVAGSPQLLSVKGAFSLTGLQSGGIGGGVTLEIDGTGTSTRTGVYNINGTLSVAPGKSFTHLGTSSLAVFNGGIIDNYGTWNCSTTGNFGGVSGGSGTGVFNNYFGASLLKSGNTDPYVIGRSFISAGTVNVSLGSLTLDGGASLDGTVSIASGATLALGFVGTVTPSTALSIGGTLSIKNNAVLAPSDSMSFSGGGRILFNGGGTPSQITVQAGETLDLGNVQLDFTGAGTLSGGAITLRSTALIAASVGLNGHVLTIAPGAVVTHQGNAQVGLTASTIQNQGNYNTTGAGFLLNNGAATFNNPGTFNNTGGTFDIRTNFNHTGTMHVEGTLQFTGGTLTSTGPITIDNGILRLSSSAVFHPGASFGASGSSNLQLRSNIAFNDNLTIPVFRVDIENNATVTIAPGKTVTMENKVGFGVCTITGGGTLEMPGQCNQEFSGVTVGANTRINTMAGSVFESTAVSNNGLNLTNGSRWDNDGTYRVSGGAGVTGSGNGTFANRVGALLEIAPTGGQTINFQATLDNTGRLAIDSGTFNLTGPWTQVSGGSLTGGIVDLSATLNAGAANSINTIGPAGRLEMHGGSSWPAINFSNLTVNGELAIDRPLLTAGTIGAYGVNAKLEVSADFAFEVAVVDTSAKWDCVTPPERPARGRRAARPAGGTVPAIGKPTSTFTNSGRFNGFATVSGAFTNNASGLVTANGANTLTFTGCVTNHGLMVISGGASLVVTSNCFTNNGTLDVITGSFTPPPGFVNNGIILGPSAVKVRSTSKVGTTVTVQIDGYTGHTYQLQRSLDLNGSMFLDIGAPQNGATGNVLSFVDGNASGGHGFYRIVVSP